MTAPVHVSLVGVLLALGFGGPLSWVMLWMLRAQRPMSARPPDTRWPSPTARVILAPVRGHRDSRHQAELAAGLAKEQHAAILLVYVIEVPWTLPLGAELGSADREAQAALEAAREIVARHGLPVSTIIRRAREAPAGIMEAAQDYQVDMVVGPDSRKLRGGPGADPGPRGEDHGA